MKQPRMRKELWKILPHIYRNMRSERQKTENRTKDIPEKKEGQPKGRQYGRWLIYRESDIPLIKPPREEQ